MRRPFLPLALAALAALPGAARAQNDDVIVFAGGRPRIGVTVDMNASAANNKLGATVQSVTPDGPAAKAGLQGGDIITRFNGISLADASAGEAGVSGPGRKLVELAQALSPGDTVKVDYRRGSASRSASIVAADLGGATFAWGGGPGRAGMVTIPDAEAARGMAMLDFERSMGDMPRQFRVAFDGGPMGLELADMNAGLGEYFGTAKGVLVLDAPADSTLPLKAGDVILAIDGRAPADVGQARRIFASYDSGDVAKIEIMRLKKKMTLSWTVPATRVRMRGPDNLRWRSGVPIAPPVPATPGAAPRVKVRVAPPSAAIPAAPTPAPAAAPAPPAPAART